MSYLRFVENSPNKKTRRVDVVNSLSHASLGEIQWYGAFRKYAFFPGEYTLFDPACLREIADQCEGMTWEHQHIRSTEED